MSDIEKIRQYIERRKEELEEQIVDIYDSKAALRKDELQKLLSFIDSLTEEGFATVNLADGDYDDGLRVHESTKSVHISYRDVKDLKQRLEGRTE